MLQRVLARVGRALDLARLFDLPDRHPGRMIAASIVLYVGLAMRHRRDNALVLIENRWDFTSLLVGRQPR